MSLEEHAKRNEIRKPPPPTKTSSMDVAANTEDPEEVPSDEEADALVERMLKEVNLEEQLGKDASKVGGHGAVDDEEGDDESLAAACGGQGIAKRG